MARAYMRTPTMLVDQVEVEQRLGAGETHREVCAALGISKELLHLRMRQWKITKKYPKPSRVGIGPYASKLNVARAAVEAAVAAGDAIETIAARYAVSCGSIRGAVKRWETQVPWNAATRGRVMTARSAGVALCVGMGLTYGEIAAAMGGLSRERVRQLLVLAVEEARRAGLSA